MKLINQPAFAIFDCDGVILNSNQVKSDAFGLALPDEDPSLVNEFVKYHQRNGGISRYIKFDYFFKEIKKQKEYKLDLENALKRYAELSKKGLLECSEIPGVRGVLEEFQSLGIPCYVASGGDQQELREVFDSRGLDGYFDEIFGSPLSKIENLESLKQSGKLEGSGLFFGDARTDMEAAEKYNLDFIFISGVSEWSDGLFVCRDKRYSSRVDFLEILRD